MRQRAVLLAVSAVAVLAAACTPGSPAQHASRQQVPATYHQACANESSVCAGSGPSAGPAGRAPAVLDRPLRLPVLRPGQACPVSAGRRLDTAYFGGTAYGNGPVKVLIDSLKLINPSSEPPWLALKTLWFSVPAYQGPFLVRARRLGAPGPAHVVDGSTAAPLVVPPGPTINSGGGWREAPSGLWVRKPGCYAFQVDGLTFSYDIVVKAVLR